MQPTPEVRSERSAALAVVCAAAGVLGIGAGLVARADARRERDAALAEAADVREQARLAGVDLASVTSAQEGAASRAARAEAAVAAIASRLLLGPDHTSRVARARVLDAARDALSPALRAAAEAERALDVALDGDPVAGLVLANAVLAGEPAEPETRGRAHLAAALAMMPGEPARAAAALDKAEAALAAIRTPRVRLDLARAALARGELARRGGDPAAASARADLALAAARTSLGGAGPDLERLASEVEAEALALRADARAALTAVTGPDPAARAAAEEAVAAARARLAPREGPRGALAARLRAQSAAALAEGDPLAARTAAEEALGLVGRVASDGEPEATARARAEALTLLGDAWGAQREPEKALRCLEDAAAAVARHEASGAALTRAALRDALLRIAPLRAAKGDVPGARRAIDGAVAAAVKLFAGGAPEDGRALVRAHVLLAALLRARGEARPALASVEAAADAAALAASPGPDDGPATSAARRDAALDHVAALRQAAGLRRELGDPDGATRDLEAAAAAGRALLAGPADPPPSVRRALGLVLVDLAEARLTQGQAEAAGAAIEEGRRQRAALEALGPRGAAAVRDLAGLEAVAAKLSGAQAPEPSTPAEHLALAYQLLSAKDPARSVASFERALEDPALRADLERSHLLHAARAAAQAVAAEPPARRDARRAQALAWLAEDLTRTRELVTKLAADAGKQPAGSPERAALEAERDRLQRHVDQARRDPAFAALVGAPEFERLFE